MKIMLTVSTLSMPQVPWTIRDPWEETKHCGDFAHTHVVHTGLGLSKGIHLQGKTEARRLQTNRKREYTHTHVNGQR
jgi:hypothetical protein